MSQKKINPHLPQMPDHSYRILTVHNPGPEKNEFISQFNKPPTITDKIFLHKKHPYALKHQYSQKIVKRLISNHLKCSEAFIRYSNDMNNVYMSIAGYSLIKKR